MNNDNIFKLAKGFHVQAKNCSRVIGSRTIQPLNATTQSLSPFSTYSGPGGGDGRGRGRGGPTPRFSFVPPSPPGQPPKPDEEIPHFNFDPSEQNGRGKGISMPLNSPSVNSFTSAIGAGRGGGMGVEGRFPFHPGRGQRDPPSSEPNRHAKPNGRGGDRGGSLPFHPIGEQRGSSPLPIDEQQGSSPSPTGEQRGSSPPPIGGRGEPWSPYQMQQNPEPNRHGGVGRGNGALAPDGMRGGVWIRSQMQLDAKPNGSGRGGFGWGHGVAGGEGHENRYQLQHSEKVVQREEVGGEGGEDRRRLRHLEKVVQHEEAGGEGHDYHYQLQDLKEAGPEGEVRWGPQAPAPQWKSGGGQQAPLEGERGRGSGWEGRGMERGRAMDGARGRAMNSRGMDGGRGMNERVMNGRGMEGGRGRGRGRGMEGGRGRGRGRRGSAEEGQRTVDLSVGNDADGELFRNRVGFDVMRQLEEGFEEVVSRTLPSPVDEAYLNASDLNYRLEFEPEFLMGDLDSNPDIHDKEPICLRDALEKAKPFLMAYEGIESHEEWEEIAEETIERVPALKKIVDHYSGPDRVTAKKQIEELENVAKTLPANVPDSIKRFTDRAVLSLQSNPGWGFHEKRQFMDKMVLRMSKHYK